jgi:hypothetical protein
MQLKELPFDKDRRERWQARRDCALGFEAQREPLERFAQPNVLQIVAEFNEIKRGNGADAALSVTSHSNAALWSLSGRSGHRPVGKNGRISR